MIKKIGQLTFILSLLVLQIHSQNLANRLSIFQSLVYFPDMKYHFNCTGLQYSHDVKKNFFITASISVTHDNFSANHSFAEDSTNYGNIGYRRNFNYDLSFGYYLHHHTFKKFTIAPFAGLSFISGMDETLVEGNWIDGGNYPFYIQTIKRGPGINAGVDFNFFPQKNISMGLFVKGRVYLHEQPDLNLGATFSLRWSDLLPKNRNTHLLENHLSIFLATTFFPDWKTPARGIGIEYSHDLCKKFFIGGSTDIAFGDIRGDNSFMHDPANFGKVVSRDYHNYDFSLGYYFRNHLPKGFSIAMFTGLSYLYGFESTLGYLHQYPHDVSVDFNQRTLHQYGLNAGANFNFFPIRTIGVGIFAKGRLYTHGQPDLMLGTNLIFRFSDPKISGKKKI
ncbi:MAG TPA: hypothetical protein VE978_02670 [Chitinophagales bacterium]|nr:hypothetical protein [Chitinophagales bacterium]